MPPLRVAGPYRGVDTTTPPKGRAIPLGDADNLDAPPGACPKYAGASPATSQQSLHRGYEVLRRCRFRHAHGPVYRRLAVFFVAVPTVEHIRDVALFEAFAELRTLAITERVIQDDSRGRLVFYDHECLGSELAVTTRAPPFEQASAISSAINGSSSQIRIEQPAKLELLMVVVPWRS